MKVINHTSNDFVVPTKEDEGKYSLEPLTKEEVDVLVKNNPKIIYGYDANGAPVEEEM